MANRKPFSYKVDVPEGRSGDWSIERFTVTRDDALRSMFGAYGFGRGVPSGNYTKLVRGRGAKATTVMSDTPDEIRDHLSLIRRAQGDVLIAGLGLGMCARACLHRDGVSSVTIIERSRDVITLVGPWLTRVARRCGKRLTIIEADIFTWQPATSGPYDVAWFDIWDEINGDNLPEMHALHRKFARKAKWKGSWGRDWIERERRTAKREARIWG